MIRWRNFSRSLVALVVVSGSCTATTAAAMLANGLPVTGEAAVILAWVFAVCMGLFAFAAAFMRLLVMPVIKQMGAEQGRALSEGLSEIGRGFEDLMIRHSDSHDPHPTLSDGMHELTEKFEDFQRYCKDHACPIAPRDPMDSSHKRRATDSHEGGPNGSGDDHRIKRGKHS